MTRPEFEGADWPLGEASRFVDAGGYRWHVQELGEGPQALLIHGTAGATHSWRGLAPLLAPRFRLLQPDLPGHGFTTAKRRPTLSLLEMARALAALTAELDWKPRVVIGHSAGAAILARLVAERKLAPEMFVSINGAFLPFNGVAGGFASALAKVLLVNPVAAHLFAWSTDRDAVARMVKGMGSRLDLRGLELYAHLLRSPQRCAGALEMMANWDLSRTLDDLTKIEGKALFIAGAGDKAISPSDAERVAQRVKHAEVVRLAGLGHLAHEESPERVAEIILRESAALPSLMRSADS